MNNQIFVLAAILLTGCAAVPIQHTTDTSMSARDAAAAVDRALMTQPPQFRPESTDVTDEYVSYGKGTISRGRNSLLVIPIGNSFAVGSGHSKSTSKTLVERIYFDTFSDAKIFKKKRRFIVNIYSSDGQPTKHFFLYNEDQAHALINGLESLKRLKGSARKDAT